jgi:tetratricopeptide (TPR) repeat protein
MKTVLIYISAALLCCGCQRTCEKFEPNITFYPNPAILECRESAFPPLNKDERLTEWGKQLRLAYAFGNDQDYYRSITAFKSALVFLPPRLNERKWQIEYGIVQSYYLGCKFQDAIEYFEASTLLNCSKEFSPYRDLLIMLYDAYLQCDYFEKACNVLTVINNEYPELANDLELSTAFKEADFVSIEELAPKRKDESDIREFIDEYLCVMKSEQKAQLYQALLPGAGYYYVGQKSAARTSLIINALFTWAAYQFFEKGYYAAGVITASLEAGWYFGGINGARLAAKEYNERVYGLNGQAFMKSHNYFPILMIETRF